MALCVRTACDVNSLVTSAAAAATRRTVPVMIDVLIGQVL